MSLSELILSLELGLIYGIVAIGIYLSFRVINFPDLTCDGSFVLGACVSCVAIRSGLNPWLSLGLASIAGGVAGFATGFLNTWFKITDLLCGILIAFMLYSINLRIMGGLPNLNFFAFSTIYTDQNPLIILGIISLIIWFIIGYVLMSDWGVALRSIGYNRILARNCGVNISCMVLVGLVMSNALIGLGGALFAQHQGFSDVGIGVGTIIIGLAAIILGERLLNFRSPLILIGSCFLGSILYRFVMSMALHSDLLGLTTQDLNLITGGLLIGVMLLRKRLV